MGIGWRRIALSSHAGIKHIIDFVPTSGWWMEQVFRKLHTAAEIASKKS